MGSQVGIALGAFASSLGNAYTAKVTREHEDRVNNAKLVSNLVSSGLENGTIDNPQEAFQFMLDNLGGTKGKNKGQLPPQIQTVLGATQKAGGATTGGTDASAVAPSSASSPSAPSTPAPPPVSVPRFTTQSQRAQNKADVDLETGQKASQAEYDQMISHANDLMKQDPSLHLKDAIELVRNGRVSAQGTKFAPGAVSGKDLPANASDIYGSALDPKKYYRQGVQNGEQVFVPTEAPAASQPRGALAERQRQVEASGVPPERSAAVAAAQLAQERSQAASNASSRLDTYIKTSRVNILKNQEAYDEMQQAFPYTLAAKMAGADIAEIKSATTGKADPSKIIEQATKTAHTLAAKQSSILMGLGLEDDEASIRDGLIRELSGGQDPKTIEAAAKQMSTSGPTPRTLPTPVVPPRATPAAPVNPFR